MGMFFHAYTTFYLSIKDLAIKSLYYIHYKYDKVNF